MAGVDDQMLVQLADNQTRVDRHRLRTPEQEDGLFRFTDTAVAKSVRLENEAVRYRKDIERLASMLRERGVNQYKDWSEEDW